MPLLLLAVLVGLPLLELYVIVQVGQEIGTLWTVAALVATSLIGLRLVRAQGRAVLQSFAAAIAVGRPPAREALDGALVFVGGALLIVPGFLTDVLGALLLAPPSRAVARGLIVRHYAGRLIGYLTRGGSGRGPGGGRPGGGRGPGGGRPGDERGPGDGRGPATQVFDVDGRAIEIDGEKLPR